AGYARGGVRTQLATVPALIRQVLWHAPPIRWQPHSVRTGLSRPLAIRHSRERGDSARDADRWQSRPLQGKHGSVVDLDCRDRLDTCGHPTRREFCGLHREQLRNVADRDERPSLGDVYRRLTAGKTVRVLTIRLC